MNHPKFSGSCATPYPPTPFPTAWRGAASLPSTQWGGDLEEGSDTKFRDDSCFRLLVAQQTSFILP
jgi:hypothetical protein